MPVAADGVLSTKRGAVGRPPFFIFLTILLVFVVNWLFVVGIPGVIAAGVRAEVSQEVGLLRTVNGIELARINKQLRALNPTLNCRSVKAESLTCVGVFPSRDMVVYREQLQRMIEVVFFALEAEGLVRERFVGGLTSRPTFLGISLSPAFVTQLAMLTFGVALIGGTRRFLGVEQVVAPCHLGIVFLASIAVLAPVGWAAFAVSGDVAVESLPVVFSAAFVAEKMLAAASEEIFFRGWIIGSLGSRLGAPVSIALSALVFSFSHSFGHPLAFVVSFIFAVCIGYYYSVRKSLLVCILAHSSYNLILAMR